MDKKYRVMVADLDRSVFETFRSILPENYEVIFVNDSFEAIRRFTGEYFDAVILELSLPYVNMENMLRILKPKSEKTRIFVLTSGNNRSAEDRLRKSGVDGFFVKPQDRGTLVDSLRSGLGQIEGAHLDDAPAAEAGLG